MEIIDLPNEILFEIFNYLSTYDILRNVAPISRKFHQLARQSIKDIQLKDTFGLSGEKLIKTQQNIQNFCEVLERSVTLEIFKLDLKFIDNFHSKEKLNSATEESISKLTKAFSNCQSSVKEVSLRFVFGYHYYYDTEATIFKDWIKNVMMNCPKLKVLKLIFCGKFIVKEATGGSGLEVDDGANVHIGQFIQRRYHFYLELLEFLSQHSKSSNCHLEKLELINLQNSPELFGMNESEFCHVQNCLNLIAGNNPKLNSIKLALSYRVDDPVYNPNTISQSFLKTTKNVEIDIKFLQYETDLLK